MEQIGIDKSYKNTRVIEFANCITAREDRGASNRMAEGTAILEISDTNRCIQAGSLNHYGNDQMNRVYFTKGVSPTILVKSGGGRETKIIEDIYDKQDENGDSVSTSGSDIASTIRTTVYKQGSRVLLKNITDNLGYGG